MSGFFGRIKSLVAAKANDKLEEVEGDNLSSLLEQNIREKTIALQEAQSDLDEVGGQVRGYNRELATLKDDLKRWENNADTALDDGDDELAEAACGRAEEVQSQINIKKQALANVQASYDSINEQLQATASEIRDAEQRLKVTQAQIKAADASKKAREKTSKVIGTGSSLDRISELEERAMQKIDAEASAAERLKRESGSDLEAKFAALEQKSSSQDRLAKLKAKRAKKEAKVQA